MCFFVTFPRPTEISFKKSRKYGGDFLISDQIMRLIVPDSIKKKIVLRLKNLFSQITNFIIAKKKIQLDFKVFQKGSLRNKEITLKPCWTFNMYYYQDRKGAKDSIQNF